jgi:acyl-CoA synthetase (AMP-forming)/AMP-acid ligase II
MPVDELSQIARWIDRAAAERGDATYLAAASGPRRIAYADLPAAVARWDRHLTDAGVPPGATVATAVADPLDAALALLGLLATGRVAAPVDPAAPRALDKRLDQPDTIAVIRDDQLERLDREPTERPGGVLLSSSGSTGEPKQVLLPDAQLAHVAAAVARSHGLGPADVGYCPLPLHHVNAEVVGLLATLRAQGTLVLARRFSRSGFWTTVDEHRATWVNAVPAILALLSEDPATTADPDRIRFVRSASAPLPVPVLERFEQAHRIRVLESYGMTEAASQITVNPLDGVRKPGSVGLPVDGELRVVGADGRPLPAGGSGTVQIRGAGVIRSYATGVGADRFDAEGWLDTGDLGNVDADGYLWLVGRASELINRSGEKILPREIEDVLREDPGVRDAVVVGRPDPVLGEVPVAYVVGAGDDPGLADRLAERCRAALARDRQPAELTVVEQLPTTGTGKVLRAEVAEMARDGGS